MNWFRTNITFGSRLALLALAIQFVTTFGHVHAAELQPGFAPSVSLSGSVSLLGQTSVATPAALADAAAVSTSDSNSSPGSSHPAADLCPICAVMVLAHAVLLATPPALLLPDAIKLFYRTTEAGFVHLNPARAAFQPRAPPAS